MDKKDLLFEIWLLNDQGFCSHQNLSLDSDIKDIELELIMLKRKKEQLEINALEKKLFTLLNQLIMDSYLD